MIDVIDVVAEKVAVQEAGDLNQQGGSGILDPKATAVISVRPSGLRRTEYLFAGNAETTTAKCRRTN